METILLVLLAAAVVDSQIRLVGPSRCSGRVEVYHDEVWGTVCDDSWDLSDAAVVCKQLGCGPPQRAPTVAYFGEGTDPIWLDNVACRGTESSLADCLHGGFGRHDCGHGEDAGVICEGPGEVQFRLAGPTRCSGRVEVYHGHAWGTVCDDGWDLSDAAVVCRQLGCGAALSAPTSAYFGQGTGEIWLSDLGCSGTEVSLSECSYTGFGIRNCDHSEDAGATCAGAQIRLTGPTRCSGRVEVLFNGTWGTVCDDGWDLSDAAVVCRQLGCGPPQAALSAASFGEGTGPVWFANMSCSGTEADLTECGHSGFGANRCGHAEDAAVVCGAPVRLAGPTRCSGRVEVYHSHSQAWGTVCDDGWDLSDAAVVCRELGCDRAYQAPGGAQFGPGTGSIMLDDLVCSGTERSLTDCGHSGFGLQNCDHDEDAGALCEGILRKVVRLKVLQDSSLDLSNPAVLDGFLNQLKQKLQDQELNGNIKLSWMTSHGKIFNKDKTEEQNK